MKLLMSALILMSLISTVNAQLPPIIDREVFFGDPEISGSQISPDGKYITFLKPLNNVRNIWIKERTQKFEDARPLTADTTRPIPGYFWSLDSKYVLYVQDKGGDENYRVYAVNPAESGDPVPSAKDLTPYDEVRAMIIDLPKGTPNEIIIGLNDRNPQLHDVYRLDLTTGERTLIRENNDNIAGWATDLKGELRLGLRVTEDGGTEILKLDGDNLESIYKVSNEESAGPLRFTPDGNSFYMISNKGNDVDKTELLLFDLNTKETTLVERDPLNEVDLSDVIFSDLTNEILATIYVGDRLRLYPKQEKFAEDYKRLVSQLPDGDVRITSITEDENYGLVAVSRDVDPGSVYFFDRKNSKVELLYRSRPNLPMEYLAPMKPVRYEARDGLTIPAYLTIPKGVEEKNLPVVFLIHGGPWARDTWGYNSIAQFLANRGYAVFQPNFRGSTGYGKKFLNAGNKQWGRGSMQHDISDGVEYLIQEGIADPEKVAIAGGSYGGYATLAGLAFTPELYAAGFSIVGPSNIITLLNSVPPYWEPIIKMFAVRVGDKDNPEELKMLEEQSPLNYATQIDDPLYVVQGANDPRVKKAESDQIVVALRDLNRNVEYMVAPDEGHGFAGLENRVAMFVAMEQFLAKYLGGRVQEDVREEIQNKLDAITVDINTVTKPKRADTSTMETLTVFDGSKISPESTKYKMHIETRGQKFDLDVSREVSKIDYNGKAAFRAVDIVTGMMGGNDTLFVDAETLLPIERNVKQGPATIKLKFDGLNVQGTMLAGPQEMPINSDLDSPVLSEGAGVEMALKSLPLVQGYKAKVFQFDLMSASAKPLIINVSGTEKITVGSKEYETLKVEVKSEDDPEGGTTYWLNQSTNTLIKQVSKLGAQMGGGTVTLEIAE